MALSKNIVIDCKLVIIERDAFQVFVDFTRIAGHYVEIAYHKVAYDEMERKTNFKHGDGESDRRIIKVFR
tara:strand:+ start:586 stop:795 length:210 start_codon:yes stop_codon:yes gene_type:complete